MSADLLKICDPLAYYNQFLLESVYPDGRSISRFRPILLQLGINGKLSGSSLARQGGATVTCRIESSLIPVSDAPVIVPVIQAAPNVSKNFVEDGMVMITQLIAQNCFCGKDALKTAGGRLTWLLHLHIMILSVDGALCDALCTCVAGALVDLRLPKVSLNWDEDIPIDITKVELSETFHHIEITDIPVSCTFIVHEGPNKEMKILCDPVSELYRIIPHKIVVVTGNNGRIHRINQLGSCGGDSTMQRVVHIAIKRQKLLADALIRARDAHLLMERKK
ncbi:unnamed protein product [Thelazia callipaeda]|uniref:Ribosomal RNA-processing protein 43 n=1 Tax=Thelazia callipaeda TaxID=103827 RepID=A0A0N5CM06_THECL|nr:unnamed protein product [Thelazia callipaeda]